MSEALYYIFGVWFALIVACAILVVAVRWLGAREEAREAGREKAGAP